MGESQVGTVSTQGALAPSPSSPESGEVLLLRRPGLWLPAYLAMYAFAGIACLTTPWALGGSDALPAVAELLRFGGRVALGCAAAAGALAWALRRPTRGIVLQDDGVWMPPLEHTSGAVWIPYRDVCALHPWHAWRLKHRRELVLGLRGRHLPRFWSARSFVAPDALEQLAGSVRGGIARLPDGAERLREIDRRAAAAAAAQRGWPRVSMIVVLALAAVYVVEARLIELNQMARIVGLANGPEALAEGELFRLVTGVLLHSGTWHLAGNLTWILVMGALCERLVGGWRFLVVLLGGGLGGMLGSSALAGQHAIGASGAGYAATACLVYLMAVYRDEVPGPLYRPLWQCILLIAFVIGVDVLYPGNIDHAGHAGGFVAGLALSVITVRGRPLAALARTPSRLATGLAAGLLALYAGGVAWGIHAVGGLPLTERAAFESAMRQLGQGDLPPEVRNDAAWHVAATPLVTHEALRVARAAAEQVVAERPDLPHVRDTLATLHYRLGDAETAAEIERRVLREQRDAFKASQLARFERARLREVDAKTAEGSGVLRFVPGAEPQVRFDSPVTAPAVLDVYALVEQPDGTLGGLAWLTLRCGLGGPDDCTAQVPDLPETSGLVVAYVAVAPEGAEAPKGRFWPMDPEAVALPGPLPPEHGAVP